MSDAAILLKRFVFEHGDQVWELGRPNVGTEAAYGRYMLREEGKFVGAQREALGPQGYQDALRLHLANGTNNWFGWNGPGFRESLASPTNAAKFLWLWFCQKSTTCRVLNAPEPPDASKPAAGPKEAMAKNESAMQLLYREPVAFEAMNRLLAEALNDPNPLPPE